MTGWVHLPARRTAIAVGGLIAIFSAILIAITVAGGQPLPVDSAVLQTMLAVRSAPLTALSRLVSDVGSPVGLIVTAAAVLGWVSRRRRSWRPLIVGELTWAAAEILGSTVKVLTARPRPPQADWVSGIDPAGLSFPSGHATQSAAVYLVVALLASTQPNRRLTCGAAAVGTALVGLSRLYLGVHWVTDVLAGWLLGTSCALIAVGVATRPALEVTRPRPE